jgi:S1-C subfamily serine protease
LARLFNHFDAARAKSMRRLFPLLSILLFVAITPHFTVAGPPTLKDAVALEEALQEAIKRAEPSIGCILITRSEDPDKIRALRDPDNVPESYGSGVMIDDHRGLVLTNYHVVKGATACYIRFPGNKAGEARIHAADPRSDLAILKVGMAVPAIPLGDGDNLRKGQIVLSLANIYAAGFNDGSPSASWGIISNIRRRAPGRPSVQEMDLIPTTLHHYGTLLQLDARLNLGCSGGAVIDLKGELIGLTSSLAALTGSETAGGFAVPINSAMKRIIGKLKEGKEVEYGFLGVVFQPNRRGPGVQVREVIAGSPAARAGLVRNDTILGINGIPVRDNDELFLTVGTMLAGSTIRLDVQRNTRPLAPVQLAKFYVRGPVVVTNKPPPVRGLRVDYSSILYQRNGAAGRGAIPPGVFISEVLPGSSAETAKLQDAIVTEVDGNPVTTPEEFYHLAGQHPGPLELTLFSPEDMASTRKVKLN